MLLIFDRATSKLCMSTGMQTPVTQLTAERGDAETLELIFCDQGIPVVPTELEVFRFVAKPELEWQAAAHVLASAFTYSATTGRWHAAVNYNVTLLNALLLIGSELPAGENAETTTLMCQLAWKPTAATVGWRRSQRVNFIVNNNVWRGDETDPATGTPEESAVLPTMIPVFRTITSDVINNNATANTIADITGLSFPVTAGAVYQFEFTIPYNAAATTTGARFAVTGPASPTLLATNAEWPVTSTTTKIANHSAYNLPSTCSTDSLTTGNVATIRGIIKPSASGNVIARFASEIANSAITVKAGACVSYVQLA